MRATTFGVYGKVLFSVYLNAKAETRSAAGAKIGFSGGFSVYLNNMRTSSAPKQRSRADLTLISDSTPPDWRRSPQSNNRQGAA